jgi:hypothetical protein
MPLQAPRKAAAAHKEPSKTCQRRSVKGSRRCRRALRRADPSHQPAAISAFLQQRSAGVMAWSTSKACAFDEHKCTSLA